MAAGRFTSDTLRYAVDGCARFDGECVTMERLPYRGLTLGPHAAGRCAECQVSLSVQTEQCNHEGRVAWMRLRPEEYGRRRERPRQEVLARADCSHCVSRAEQLLYPPHRLVVCRRPQVDE
jgi:hypothetical protein